MNRIVLSAAVLAAAGFATFANADTTYYIPSYQITNDAPNPITDMMEFWTAPDQGIGIFWGNNPDGGITADGNGTVTSTSDLPKPVYPSGVLIMGVYNDDEGAHLTLFMDPTTAADVTGVDFDTVFPNSNETQLIDDLEIVCTDPDSDDWGQPLNDIFNFAGGDAMNIPDGDSTQSAWLTPFPDSLPTPGTIETWSGGAPIGTFTATIITQAQTQATPGPAAILPFAVSGIGLLRRRFKTN